MEKKELQEICEVWTEYLQCSTDNQNVRYFIREDGQLMYEDEDENLYESTEKKLIQDINDTFEDFFCDKQWSWIQAEYIEEVLGIDYDSQQTTWLQVAEILSYMRWPRNEVFCLDKIKDKFWSPMQRAEYILNTLD